MQKFTNKLILTITFLLIMQSSFGQGVGYDPFPNSYNNLTSDACIGGNSSSNLDVFFDFYKVGVTDAVGAGAGVSCEVMIRKDGPNRDLILNNTTAVLGTYPANYISDNGNNDRFQAVIPSGLDNGRYTWECKCSHGGTDYLSWDYGTNSGNSLQYFTVGTVGIFRSMVVLNDGSGNTYYDLQKFQPGNTDLPAQINGSNGGNGFCTTDPLTLVGSEINIYKNNWNGANGNMCSGVFHVEVEVAGLGGIGCTVGSSSSSSFAVSFRDDCPMGYINTFPFGGSCQNQDANSTDQRWENLSANIDLMAMATSLCDPNFTTDDVTYTLRFYTETTLDCAGGCTLIQREPAVGFYSSSFTVNGDADSPGGCVTALPVELMNFEVLDKGRDHIINWTTASEVNSSSFDVERSYNGSDFETIHELVASGESFDVLHYQFIDEKVEAGKYLYRLKMIDLDGSFEYSEVRSIHKKDGNMDITLSPNPTKGILSIQQNSSKNVNVQFYNIIGQEVYSITNHDNEQDINIGHLEKGIYFVLVSIGEESRIEKLILH